MVDGGPEFASMYFETLLAHYEVIKKTRPGAKPRFGSVIERLFGTTNTAFLYTLAGNTQASRVARQMTPDVEPTRLACWTLDRLSVALERWATTIYAETAHPALGQSPQAAWDAGLRQAGPRTHRQIPYDDMFVLATFPTTAKGTAKVQPNLGVKIHTLYYWADVFREPGVEGQQVPVRYDPDDAGVAFAFVRGRWVRCISEQHARFAGRSEREIALATAELRRRRQTGTGQATITAQALGAFLISLDAEEVLLNQRLRDLALRDLAQPVGEMSHPDTPLDQPVRPTLVNLTPYEDYA
jgi:putative transposase